jgi:ubiquinone/menaquinone biosynthesis C-methylase UbiE
MDSKMSVKQQFSKNAKEYRDERLFAEGEDLHEMVNTVSLKGTEKVLDIATGAGHTALAFAPHVSECIAIDLTKEMVVTASELARDRGVKNVQFQIGDAEKLPFPDGSFDIVTCRFAAHHFGNVEQAVSEVARVLKPGGTFLLVDHYAPAEIELDYFVNQLDRMRDPSHVRESTLSEWKGMFTKHHLSFKEILKWDLPLKFQNWVERAGTPSEKQQEIVEFMSSATKVCKEIYHIVFNENGYPESFCLKAVLLHGSKL